jgi:hypothetical protein
MAFRVLVGNIPVECDSLEEALELAKRADGAPASRKPGAEANTDGSRWTKRRVADFFDLIEGNQQKLIDALLEHSEGRTDEQLLQLLSLKDGRQLAGVTAGMAKNAKKVGADPEELYIRKRVIIGGRKVHEYMLTDSFRRAAESMKA